MPSIVFRSGALPELVRDGVDGLVCELPSADALRNALNFYLENAHQREQHGSAALASAAPFGRAQFARKWAGQFGADPDSALAATTPVTTQLHG